MPYRKDLTVQERKFLNAYVENGGNAVQAYRAAGYSKNARANSMEVMACQLLKKPKIVTALHKRLEEIDRACEIRLENKRLALWDIAQDGMQKIPLPDQSESQPVEKMIDSRTSVQAIGELNKMDGHHAGQNLYIRSEQFVFGQVLQSEPAIDGELADDPNGIDPA